MLPEARDSLLAADFNTRDAGLITLACFICGFLGIQAFTRLLHQFMPSHVVDCDHTHEETAADDDDEHSCNRDQTQSRPSRPRRTLSRKPAVRRPTRPSNGFANHTHESTPLLGSELNGPALLSKRHASLRGEESGLSARSRSTTDASAISTRRQSMKKRVMSFVRDTKCNCGELGSCYGYSDPCGQECFKHITSRPLSVGRLRHSILHRTNTGPFCPRSGAVLQDAGEDDHAESEPDLETVSPRYQSSRASSRDPWDSTTLEEGRQETEDQHHESDSSELEGSEAQHHHHVPMNAFMAIGLQTSVAITVHKFPEGFVTYATNHANPSLGLNVFLALFVHNLCEGFTMALPLYMALNSRWRALAWASALGGLSQPLGALIAFLVLEVSKNSQMAPNAVAYACLFAVTSGMMISVGLQLFVESLSLNHDRNLCILFAFLGMALLGVSNAIFSGH